MPDQQHHQNDAGRRTDDVINCLDAISQKAKATAHATADRLDELAHQLRQDPPSDANSTSAAGDR